MNDLINGRTKEGIVASLRACAKGICDPDTCVFTAEDYSCEEALMGAALGVIEHYERRIEKQNDLLALMGITIPEEVGL